MSAAPDPGNTGVGILDISHVNLQLFLSLSISVNIFKINGECW